MDKAPEILTALQTMLAFFDSVGLPGLVAIFFTGPAIIVMALISLDYLRQRHARKDADARRKEAEEYRQQLRDLHEMHRSDMERVLRDYGEKHAEAIQIYKDNVELVKAYQRLSSDMRDIITNNTLALQHLTSLAQANFFCPIAREKATGKQ